jgi:glycosyltransferase involved in cell wall biosynthesis
LVVVNGPSTDNTVQVLDEIEESGIRLKRAECTARNLSASRNIGINKTSGDVVLFIDDDAVAHPSWVARLIAKYDDPLVGAAGGFTFDHTGVAFQRRYTVCDKFGNAHLFNAIDFPPLLGKLGRFLFPSLLGTNCSFSRAVLEDIGGFDEIFEYMLDETDVCLRVVEHERRVVTVPDAYVFHKYAPSDTRTLTNVPKALLAPARSKAYFCYKHASRTSGDVLNVDVVGELEKYRKDMNFSIKWFLDHKQISPARYVKLAADLSNGIADGMRIGLSIRVTPLLGAIAAVIGAPNTPYTPVMGEPASTTAGRALRVYFVSQGFPPHDTAGIARWTHECARELCRRGHEVHVITRSRTLSSHVDYLDGVWVHSVADAFDDELTFAPPVPLPASIARRASAVLKEIQRSQGIWGVDIVSAPIWDVEGIMCAAHLRVPVVTSLHTTYKLVAPYKPEWTRNESFKSNHVEKVIRAEYWLLRNSVAILANSKEIVEEINKLYDGVLAGRRNGVTHIPHGLGAPIQVAAGKGSKAVPTASGRIKLLFVGRIEERKGIDVLLAALNLLPELLASIQVDIVGAQVNETGAYAAKVRRLADELKRRSSSVSVVFHGYVPDADLERHYSGCDIFIAPSRFESFGLILIEAMRHGVPVIASDIGGMREVITDSVDGYLVGVDNSAQLAARIKLLVERADLRAQVGRAAKTTFESRFAARHMAAMIDKTFESIVEAGRNERH